MIHTAHHLLPTSASSPSSGKFRGSRRAGDTGLNGVVRRSRNGRPTARRLLTKPRFDHPTPMIAQNYSSLEPTSIPTPWSLPLSSGPHSTSVAHPAWRARRGKYRVIYHLDDRRVIVDVQDSGTPANATRAATARWRPVPRTWRRAMPPDVVRCVGLSVGRRELGSRHG
jgi:hypothetical protein